MAKFIEIGGQHRPVAFGMEAFYLYELETGKSMDELVQRVMTAGAQAINNPEQANGGSIVDIVELSYWGLRTGSEVEWGRPFEASRLQVASWFNGNLAIIPDLMRMLAECLPRVEEVERVQKKTAGRQQPTKKTTE